MGKYDTVIFDFDGTLVDGLDAITECFEMTFRHFKLTPPSKEDLRRKIGLPLIDVVKDYLLGKNKPAPVDFVEVYHVHARKILPVKTFLRPNIIRTLNLLYKNRIKLGIATTKSTATTEKTLENLGIRHVFGAVCGVDLIRHPKPAPEQLLLAAAKLQSEPFRTIMIGDTYMDIEAAKSAGMISVGILDGFGEREKILKSKPDIIVEDVSNLFAILALFFGLEMENKLLLE